MNTSITHFRTRSLRAFSLSELLVVLVIVGILVLIALPNLMPLISRAKATEAQQQLTYLHTLQKSNFYTYSRYSSSLEELGFEQSPLVTDGGSANYQIEIVENKPLARMLYHNVEIGAEIPPELYQMVAEVLAYVYNLKGKTG